MANKASSPSTASACCIQSSHNSSTVSWIKPSPKMCWVRRRSATAAPTGLRAVGLRPQPLLIELADLLEDVLHAIKVLQVASDPGDGLLGQTEVADHPFGVADGEDPRGLPLTTSALRAGPV